MSWTENTGTAPEVEHPFALAHSGQTVTIGETAVPIVEHQGHRMITLAMIDKLHGRPEGTAGRNFRQHRERLVEGEDFFILTHPDEIRRVGLARRDRTTPASVTLVAESGYLMLVKFFQDDLAWAVQRKLVAAYFRQPRAFVAMTDEEVLARGLLLAGKRVQQLQAKVSELTPKAAALERIAAADGSHCITDAAKALQVRPKDLFGFLTQHGWIYRRTGSDHWCGYQARIVSGDLVHKVTTVLRADGSEKTTEQVRVTARGLAKLAKLVPGAARKVA